MNETYHVINITQPVPISRAAVPSAGALLGPPAYIDNENFTRICRLCAVSIQSGIVPLFEGEGLQKQLADKINKHLPIEVSLSDVLPRVVCEQCAATVLAWHQLTETCLEAQAALQSRLQSTNTTSIINHSLSNGDSMETDMNLGEGPGGPSAALPLHAPVPHMSRLFYCGACDSYVDRRNFIEHISYHRPATRIVGPAPPRPEPRRPEEARGDTEKPTLALGTNPERIREERTGGRDLDANAERGASRTVEETQTDESASHSDGENVEPPEPAARTPGASQDAAPGAEVPAGPAPAGSRGRARSCGTCGKEYRAASSYFYHVKHAHGATFTSRALLAQHGAAHEPAARLACARCPAAFRSRAALYIHAQTHGADKRHVCAQCGRAFRWRAALGRHTARHGAARAHSCPSCGRSFAVRADLLRHARTHSPRRATCPHCRRHFAQPRYLRVHLNNKHPNEPAPPDDDHT